jgi:hypothetical protein
VPATNFLKRDRGGYTQQHPSQDEGDGRHAWDRLASVGDLLDVDAGVELLGQPLESMAKASIGVGCLECSQG